jgi:rhamnose transport system permease protein
MNQAAVSTTPGGVSRAPQRSRGGRAIRRMVASREAALLATLIGIFAAMTVLNPIFLSTANIRNMVLDVSILVIAATAQTMVIITRNFDLSVGAMLALAAYVMGSIFIAFPGLAWPIGVTLAMGFGLLFGAVNGTLVAALRVPSIIATIGTLSVYRGFAFVLADGSQIGRNQIPNGLVQFTQAGPAGVPWLILLAATVALLAELILRMLPAGRAVYAVGSNPDGARLRGIAVRRVLFGVFAVSGLLAGLAGAMFAGRYGNVNPSDANGFEFQVIAAVVIGGTAVNGGSGSIIGTVLGCMLLGAIANILTISNVDPLWQVAVQGGVILAAATMAAVLSARRTAAGARASG